MNSTADRPVVIVPGLRDHVAEHWQTLLAHRLDRVRTVPPLARDTLSRRARVAALDAVLTEVDGPVVLVAHSAGVITTVHWAQQPTRPPRQPSGPPPITDDGYRQDSRAGARRTSPTRSPAGPSN